ncbi:uncharacterized protein [Dysidea avara]
MATGLMQNPIPLDSSQSIEDPMEIYFDETGHTTYCTYCPVVSGKVIPAITVKDREGIWRLGSCKFHAIHEDVLSDELIEQPELQNYFLTELYSDGVAYLQAQLNTKLEVLCEEVTFHLKEKGVVHNKQYLTILENTSVPLVVISPNHGSVQYTWEQRLSYYLDQWKTIRVPPWTCVLYASTVGQYRCTVEAVTITFDVKGYPRKSKSDSLMVPYKELEFKEIVGRGTFGEVYRGVWKGEVALKKINISAGEDTCTIANSAEIKALKLLKHPNIVSLLGYSTAEREIVIIMEFINGKNLHTMIFGKDKIISRTSNMKRLHIAKGVAYGLEFMHTHNPVIIHQDIKPLNIMVTANLEGVYICDMGISKLREAEATITTATIHMKGTYPYMAPEMYGPNRRGTAVDVYAFGCLMIELFGQKKVWGELVTAQIMQKVCGSFNVAPQPPNVNHLPLHLQDFCRDCCQLDVLKRPKICAIVKTLENCSN